MSYATQYRDAWARGINTRGAKWARRVKWRGAAGLGSLDNGQTYGIGQQLVAGYNVQSSADAATKLQAVRDAMAYGFRGAIVSVGWGGPSAPGGVPAGQIYVVVRIAAAGVTGQVMNTVFSNVGANIQSRLPAGSRVTNTYASIYQGLVSGTTGGSSVTAPTTGGGILDSLFAPTTTTTTTPTTDTTLPTDLTATTPQPFFMQEVGGVPVWVLGVGGVALLGGIAFVALRKPHAAPKVTANRRRRVRRNGWRRRYSRSLKGSRRSRRSRRSMRANRRRSRRSRRSVRANRRSRRSRRSVRRNTKLSSHQRAMLSAAHGASRPHYAGPKNYLGGRRTYDWGMYGYPFVSGRKRRAKLSRKSRSSMRSLRRNDHPDKGWEFAVHGNSLWRHKDPFSLMTKADYQALGRLYRTQLSAIRTANRLQRKYAGMIDFRVKARPTGSGGFGVSEYYASVGVGKGARKYRRTRAKLRARVSQNPSLKRVSVMAHGRRYTRRTPHPGDVFYVAKPTGTVPLTSPLMKVRASGVYEDTTTGTLYDPRVAGIKTAWVWDRAHHRRRTRKR